MIKKSNLKAKQIVSVIFLMMFYLGWGQAQVVRGATSPTGIDLNRVLTADPQATFANNSARVSTRSDTDPTSLITLTDARQQTGAVWSSDQAYFDLNEATTIGFWFNCQDLSLYSAAGEGFAFVLQNDPRGAHAITSFNDQPVSGGESLGVWAADQDSRITDPTLLAKTAVQNSWALEFDSQSNSGFSNNAFDLNADQSQNSNNTVDLSNDHIAANYPAQASTYVRHTHFLGSGNYFGQKHDPILQQKVNLADGAWHHVTLRWDPHANEMAFFWDDHGQAGPLRPQTIKIDPHKFNSRDGHLRWGFTGTTDPSSNYQRTQIIVDQAPRLHVKVTSQLVNQTTEKIVHNGDSVHGGNLLELSHQLTYEAGTLPWQQIHATIYLPFDADFQKAQIIYRNGTTIALPATALHTDDNDKTQWFDLVLPQQLDSSNDQVTIKIDLKVEGLEEERAIMPAIADFETPLLKRHAVIPAYILDPNRFFKLSDPAADSYFVTPEQPLTPVQGQFGYYNRETPDQPRQLAGNEGFFMECTLNGQSLPPITLPSHGGNQGHYQLWADAGFLQQLHLGKNTFTYRLADKFKNYSAERQITITSLTGSLRFGLIAQQSSFRPLRLTGQTQTAVRADNWALEVVDGRIFNQGTIGWQLLAQATPLTTDHGQRLPGELVYRANDQEQSLSTPTIVATNTTTSGNQLTRIPQNLWQADNGILLKVHSNAIAGQYSGQITWTLQDGPESRLVA
ncbi:lectin-like domain-containing protein [Lapidilactobacillus luobeiensis]|uniref:lectin-like domain-containing protein n=1 Tax=Lapidilactobacillus luobeiensis TaxID=2950371 RepID=UPI0021C33209|nr:hypothetical protein [Lapidilactobacillus luobeiensis]